MGDQRIDTGAAAATGGDADPGEGQGVATDAAHPGGMTGGAVGEADDRLVPGDERSAVDETPDGDTEGERFLNATHENQADPGGATRGAS